MTDENTAQYWQKVREIYEKVLDAPTDQREASLRAACGDDVDLQRKVEFLLRALENNPDFLETPLDLTPHVPDFVPSEDRLGAYRLLRRLGAAAARPAGCLTACRQGAAGMRADGVRPRRSLARPGPGSGAGLRGWSFRKVAPPPPGVSRQWRRWQP